LSSPWSLGHPFLAEGPITGWTTWILHCLTYGLLHTSLNYIFKAARRPAMTAFETLKSTLRKTPAFVSHLLSSAMITGIVAI